MTSDYGTFLAEKGRLAILQALAAEFDGSLGDDLLQKAVDLRLVRRSIDWIRTQLTVLDELGAVSIEGAVVSRVLAPLAISIVKRSVLPPWVSE